MNTDERARLRAWCERATCRTVEVEVRDALGLLDALDAAEAELAFVARKGNEVAGRCEELRRSLADSEAERDAMRAGVVGAWLPGAARLEERIAAAAERRATEARRLALEEGAGLLDGQAKRYDEDIDNHGSRHARERERGRRDACQVMADRLRALAAKEGG